MYLYCTAISIVLFLLGLAAAAALHAHSMHIAFVAPQMRAAQKDACALGRARLAKMQLLGRVAERATHACDGRGRGRAAR